MDDIKELVNLAKELEFDENQSFFSKVEAVTEGRCNSKFMDTLLKNLKTATTAADNQLHLGGEENHQFWSKLKKKSLIFYEK